MKLSNKQETGKKHKSGVTTPARIMALVLAVLMVLGSFALLLQILLNGAYNTYAYNDGQYDDEPMVRVGLMYGSDVTVGFEVTADSGFEFGVIDSNNKYNVLWQTSDTRVSVTCDTNLGKTGMSYYISNDISDIKIGTYHLSVYSSTDPTSVQLQIEMYNNLLSMMGYSVLGMYAFPAYTDGSYYVYIGNFPNKSSAESAISMLSPLGILQASIVGGSEKSISVVNPETDRILFEFDSFTGLMFGMTPVQTGLETSYIVTPAKNKYSGIFRFTRYYANQVEGVQVVNVLPLEEYVEGVLPWEINNQWAIEAQKAFAVTVRSYTLATLGRHESLDFDLCNNTHCQMYKGRNKTNENVEKAVSETSKMVLTYNGSIAATYYSSSCGGSTVSVSEAWGGSTQSKYPYLTAIATPWENYEHYNNGSWTVEVSPVELCQTLRDNGYTKLTGSIANVKINKLATNSTYVYSITFTDTYGNSVTVEYTDKVRTALSGIVKSANFVVAKAGETVEIIDYTPIESINSGSTGNTDAGTTGGWFAQVNASDVKSGSSSNLVAMTNELPTTSWYGTTSVESGVHVLTSKGEEIASVQEYISIINNNGTSAEVNLSSLTVITGSGQKNYDMVGEISGEYDYDDDEWHIDMSTGKVEDYSNSEVQMTVKTVVAEGSYGNFVFIGRGWGHGVGISQYGTKDLAELGYKYDQILEKYFPGTATMSYEAIGY